MGPIGIHSIPTKVGAVKTLFQPQCALQARAADEFLVYRCVSAWFHERAKVPKPQQGAGLGWAPFFAVAKM